MTTITIGAAPRRHQAFADFFDGSLARPQRVELAIDEAPTGAILIIAPPEAPPLRWRLDDLRAVPDQADRSELIVAEAANPVARLIVGDAETLAILRARAANLHRRPVARGRGRLVAWAFAAVASVALIIFLLVPTMADQLARYLPPEGEKALGDTTLEQIRSALSSNAFMPVNFCENREGLAALDRMTEVLTDGVPLPYEIDVHVLDNDTINAFALPGGHIVFFRGLIDAARRPEEVAAVYAHELGHVVHRDPTRSALRTAGSVGVLGLLFGDFAGGTAVLFITERLIEAAYSQSAEAGADAFAHRAMANAGLPPAALADFFERLRERYGDKEGFTQHFMAHPRLGDRIEAARAAPMPVAERPLMSDEEWQALKAVCR